MNNVVRANGLGPLENFIRNRLGSGPAIRDVVFDTEVIIRSSRVVRSGQQYATIGLVLPDDVRRCWSGQDRILSDDELLDTIARSEFDDGLNRGFGEKPTVAANDNCLCINTNRVEDRLNEVLGVVLHIYQLHSIQ